MDSVIDSLSIPSLEILKGDEKGNVKIETYLTNNNLNLKNEYECVNEQEIINQGIQFELMKQNQTLKNLTNCFQRMVKKTNTIQSELQQSELEIGKQNDEIKKLRENLQQSSLEKEELQNLIEDLQSQLSTSAREQKSQKRKFEFQLEDLNEQLKEAQNQIGELETTINEIKFEKLQVQNDFDNFKQQHTLIVEQAKIASQTANKKAQEEVKSLYNKINQLNLDIQNLELQQSDANDQIKDRESKTEAVQQKFKILQQTLDTLKSDSNNLSQQKKTLESTIKQLQDELTEGKKQYEAEKAKYRTAESEKTQLKGQLQQKEIELSNEKTNHEATKREKFKNQEQYYEQYKKLEENFKELQQQTTNEVQRLLTQVMLAEKSFERVVLNLGDTKIFEKITGPLEKIMASEYKINKFAENPNSQLDNTSYNLIEITLQFDKYNKYVKEGKFLLIDECFQYGNKINITATRSIQANAESEFFKGHLLKINESTSADLKTKTLLRKDLKQFNKACQNKEEAARLAVNNFFCQWLQIQFNKDLVIAKLQPQKQTIHRQFIIENEAKKEFYYCEMVEEGPFQKINGGKFVPQKDDIHQYFNALSLYSNKMFEQQLILTNFQVCGDYVYDMIVHTNHIKLFSPLDQGPHESPKFSESITKQSPDFYSKGWNEIVRSQAEKYLK